MGSGESRAEFPSCSLAEWKKLVETELKGAPFDKKLVRRSHEGVAVQPLYAKENASAPVPGAGARASGWTIAERLTAGPDHLDMIPFVEAGAHAVQELSIMLAAAAEHWRSEAAAGRDLETCARETVVMTAAGPQFFTELAKLRAARALWASFAAACGVSNDAQRIRLHGQTAAWNQTVLDPQVNMLRVTSEALSLVLGGCEVVAVTPFDESFRAPDAFSQRIAHNVQILLREESHFDAVADPAGGSWYVESLTREFCDRAWEGFQKIEREGGYRKALESGALAREIAVTAAARAADVARRKEVLIGTSMYVNLEDEVPARVETRQGVLPRFIAAEGYEALRRNALAFKAQKGRLPQALLLAMGPRAQHKARADFSRNFLEPGGFAVKHSPSCADAGEAIEAARASEAELFVICSTDETYPDLVPPIARAIKESMPDACVIVAGYPEAQLAAFRESGVDEFIHLRAEHLPLLETLQSRAGVRHA